MELRLNTSGILQQIENFLRGGRYIPRKVEGQIKYEFQTEGVPKMNEEGIQSLMSLLTPWFSPHTVQGNFTPDQYDDYIFELDISISTILSENMPDWEVKDRDYNQICQMIVQLAMPFFSRTINDGERGSYANTMHVSESNTLQEKSGFKLPLIGR